MTTPHQAYNQGVNDLANYLERDDPYLDLEEERELITGQNPYPEDETWTLFEPSDDLNYRALDGREAKLVHEDGAELTFTLCRDPEALAADTPYDWDAPRHAGVLFTAAWVGYDGWKMYIQGELPTKRVTADTLEPGTGFAGVAPNGRSYHSLIRIISAQGKSLVLSTSSIEYFKAKEVEVSEVYGIGTFQKPTKENQ